jgi:hypothetical protein
LLKLNPIKAEESENLEPVLEQPGVKHDEIEGNMLIVEEKEQEELSESNSSLSHTIEEVSKVEEVKPKSIFSLLLRKAQ